MRENAPSPRKIDPVFLGRLLLRVKVDANSGCWGITGRSLKKRVRLCMAGGLVYAYRFTYETLMEPILEGMVIDHLCGNPGCLNPLHMEPTTVAENARRANAGKRRTLKTRCIHGHLLAGRNLSISYDKAGHIHRRCGMCRSRSAKAYEEKKGRLAASKGRNLIGGIEEHQPRKNRAAKTVEKAYSCKGGAASADKLPRPA